jgi:hypothetical protein
VYLAPERVYEHGWAHQKTLQASLTRLKIGSASSATSAAQEPLEDPRFTQQTHEHDHEVACGIEEAMREALIRKTGSATSAASAATWLARSVEPLAPLQHPPVEAPSSFTSRSAAARLGTKPDGGAVAGSTGCGGDWWGTKI